MEHRLYVGDQALSENRAQDETGETNDRIRTGRDNFLRDN
jgi:hypothetical protein